LRNEYEVLDISRKQTPTTEKHVHYIHGLALEGADWDPHRKLIVDSNRPERFVPFPAMAVRTLKVGEASGPSITPLEDFANFGLNKVTRRPKKKKGPEEKGKPNKATG